MLPARYLSLFLASAAVRGVDIVEDLHAHPEQFTQVAVHALNSTAYTATRRWRQVLAAKAD